MSKNVKLGHQAPKGFRGGGFNSIEIEGDLAYCSSHDFVYDVNIENEKLYNAKPCYYTDNRYIDTPYNFYKNTFIKWNRFSAFSLKTCVRRTLKCRNIPIGSIVNFKKSWFFRGLKIDNSFNFKIKRENKFEPKYEINSPSFFKNFTNCDKSKLLVDELRRNNFIVSVYPNKSFIKDMLNSAISLNGEEIIDSTIDGEIAIAYGFGKKIGFSSFSNDFKGYSNGCENILFDYFDEFNKWSQCYEINKNRGIEDIINTLINSNNEENI